MLHFGTVSETVTCFHPLPLQLFIILVALELLLLCLRSLYFCMAVEKVGALLRMVLIVIKVSGTFRHLAALLLPSWFPSPDMRYFFLMLVFLLVCWHGYPAALTYSALWYVPSHSLLPQDMRYFFLMLVFLLVCFGLTFSVLMSPASSEKLNLVTLVGRSSTGEVAGSEVQVFGSLEVGHALRQWECDQLGNAHMQATPGKKHARQ